MFSNNSSTQLAQFARSSPCSSELAWKHDYLTPPIFIMIVVAVVVRIVSCPLTTLLNGLVIVAVKKKHYLRKQRHSVLAACLAVTDLLVGAVVLPLTIATDVMRLSGRGPMCLLNLLSFKSAFIACGASLYHLLIISAERYIAIKHTYNYEALVTTGRLKSAVAIAWAIPVLLSVVAVALELTGEIEARDQMRLIVPLLTCPVIAVVIAYCQVTMYLESRRHRRDIAALQVSQSAAQQIL